MTGRIEFNLGWNRPTSRRIEDGDGRCIYLLGRYSGRSGAGRPIVIDLDNFDQVLAELAPTVTVTGGQTLPFAELDDFHPDRWLKRIALLADLSELKTRLNNPATAELASAAIRQYLPIAPAVTPPPATAPTGGESDDETLRRLLGRSSEAASVPTDKLTGWLDGLVAPHVSRATLPEHTALADLIDAVVGQYLRGVLHAPAFQDMEALWRATRNLVGAAAEGEHRLFLIDADPAAFDAATAAAIVEHARRREDDRSSMVLIDHRFGLGDADRALLAAYADLAASLDGCAIGGIAADWAEAALTRHAPSLDIAANRIVLAYPRYLMRLPYGAKRDPLESLAFEECALPPAVEELLWGNPAFLCAQALLKANPEPEDLAFPEIPVFAYSEQGETVLQAGAETVLSESQIQALLASGITPVLGFRQRPGVRLLAIVALADAG